MKREVLKKTMKKAVIIGLENQDAYYLSELLINKGYSVIGLFKYKDLLKDYIYYSNNIKYVNLLENDIENILRKVKPHEVYNLYVSCGSLTRKVLKCISVYELKCKYYQSSNAILFEKFLEEDVCENEFFVNSRGYLYSYWRTKSYRECYNIFACNGVLFNHESVKSRERNSASTIAQSVVMISLGLKDIIYIDNLDYKKEWGYTKDYIRGIWMMMQSTVPSDYVLSSNEVHSIREFIEKAFYEVGITIKWRGKGIYEEGYNERNGKVLVKINKENNVSYKKEILCGNSKKAEQLLNWRSEMKFLDLIKKLVSYYKNSIIKEVYLKG